jgi:uncharacterized protein
MPEYLAPGVYIEEVSFRPKSIEGVSTSTAGFVGPTRYGPTDGEPELVTSFGAFERIYGGIDRLQFAGVTEESVNYVAHAVRAFFDNGGRRLYVSRVYAPTDPADEFSGHASLDVGSPTDLTLRARFPGAAGGMTITFSARPLGNALVDVDGQSVVRGARENDTVYIHTVSGANTIEGFYDVAGAGQSMSFTDASGATVALSSLVRSQHTVHPINLSVRVRMPGRFSDEQVWSDLGFHPQHRNSVQTLFTADPNTRNRYLTIPFAIDLSASSISGGADLAEALLSPGAQTAFVETLMSDTEFDGLSSPPGTRERPRRVELETVYVLAGGTDGDLPGQAEYRGQEAIPDPAGGTLRDSSGLRAFESLEDISIVAAPGYSFRYSGVATTDAGRWAGIVQELIIHCEIRMRYRVALLDSPNDAVLSEVRDFRGQFDSTHAALYYPWVTVIDPLDPDGRREISLPPSGFAAGICARTDVQHGVFKAPANEVVLGAIGFEKLLNKAQQDVLNPEGINCLRFFEGRGYRVWGARTISSDPEWKYLSVRRYFAYLEHSIDRGTQWAVFENNNDSLWSNIRRTVEDFLLNEWRNGALLGTKPEQAYFVRCDRSTMTQNDLDNGRLICLIGVAVVKPAEFVIFRIGQWTAESRA